MKPIRLFRKNRPRPVQFLKDLVAYLRLRADSDFWETLEPVFDRSSSTGCDYSELLKIHRHVLRHRPTAILELGSGVSTVVIAHAVKRLAAGGHVCRFVSMEEGPEWHRQLQEIFPEALRSHVELLQSETHDRHLPNGLIARAYLHKPALAYDFVFIDGPQVPKKGGYFDADILDVLDWNENAFVAFLDQRIATRAALRQVMPWARMTANREFAVFRVPPAAARV